MENNKSILTAPEFHNVPASLDKFRSLPGKELATSAEFYAFVTTPSVERDQFLAQCNSIPEVANNIIRQKFL